MRKIREGIVVSNAMQKTIVVREDQHVLHPLYKKNIKKSKKYYVHDENSVAKLNDKVRIEETRPLSKTKRWRLVEVI